MKRYLLPSVLLAFALIAGCAKESSLPNPTGEGRIRAINAISTSPSVSFLAEERIIATAEFKSATTTARYDDLDYTFNFDVFFPGNTAPTRVASQYIDVQKDKDYTLMISGALAAPDVTMWESDIREWTGTESAYEIRVAHVSPQLGAVDVYFNDVGVPPAAGNAIATASFGDMSTAVEFPGAPRVLYITPAGDDSTVLFESSELSLVTPNSYTVALFDTDANDVGPIAVILINDAAGGGGRIIDTNERSTGRFYQASLNFPDSDIYIDDPLTTPVVTGHTFRDITADIPIGVGSFPLTYTTTGNMGSILIDDDRTLLQGVHANFYVSRDPDGVDVVTQANLDRRSVETRAKLAIVNTAADHPSVDVYLAPSGEPIDNLFALFPSVDTQDVPFMLAINAAVYDIYVTEPGEKNIYLGPVPVDLQPGGVTQLIIYDTVDPNIPELVVVSEP